MRQNDKAEKFIYDKIIKEMSSCDKMIKYKKNICDKIIKGNCCTINKLLRHCYKAAATK